MRQTIGIPRTVVNGESLAGFGFCTDTSVSKFLPIESLVMPFRISLLLVASIGGASLLAAPPEEKRSPIPKWDNVKGIFFEDAFVEALSGKRPESLGAKPKAITKNRSPKNAKEDRPAAGSAWSKLISTESIENELKAIKIEVDRIVTTPSKFRGGGYQEARLQFTTAAMLFGIAAEYGTETRWQKFAGGTRDSFARAAANCKVGDIRAYNEAKLRKADLHDLLSGARIESSPPNPDATWEQIVNRSPVMQRLEVAHEDRLTKWTASEAEFSSNADQIKREAELIAAIAHLLKQDEMEDTGDDTYEEYCDAMRDAARNLVKAVEKNDPAKARAAAGAIGQSCSQCHEDYRG